MNLFGYALKAEAQMVEQASDPNRNTSDLVILKISKY